MILYAEDTGPAIALTLTKLNPTSDRRKVQSAADVTKHFPFAQSVTVPVFKADRGSKSDIVKHRVVAFPELKQKRVENTLFPDFTACRIV